jgi:hypothetical protein
MDRDQIVKMVDEVVEGLMEGGPGSGRYPEGSGKHPDADDEKESKPPWKGDKPSGYPEALDRSKLRLSEQYQHIANASIKADDLSVKALKISNMGKDPASGLPRGRPIHAQAAQAHEDAARTARSWDQEKLARNHDAASDFHKKMAGPHYKERKTKPGSFVDINGRPLE